MSPPNTDPEHDARVLVAISRLEQRVNVGFAEHSAAIERLCQTDEDMHERVDGAISDIKELRGSVESMRDEVSERRGAGKLARWATALIAGGILATAAWGLVTTLRTESETAQLRKDVDEHRDSSGHREDGQRLERVVTQIEGLAETIREDRAARRDEMETITTGLEEARREIAATRRDVRRIQ